MKKFFVVVLALVLALSATGCESAPVEATGDVPASESESDISAFENEAGQNVLVTDSGTTVFSNTLPTTISYNGKEISLCDVRAYQDYSAEHGYSLYIVAEFDVSALDEVALHWLTEDDAFAFASVTSENNRLDGKTLSFLGALRYYNTLGAPDRLYYVFTDSSAAPFSFAGAEIAVSITIWQEDTYVYESSAGMEENAQKTNALYFEQTLGDDLPASEAIEEPLYSHIVEWLEDNLNALYGMLG